MVYYDLFKKLYIWRCTSMKKKKLGIIDADLIDNGTRHPNLVCMKISAYYKEKGWDVKLLESYDEDKIISRAMDYVVKSHSSIDEQYIRITEYILAIDGMECRVTRTCTNSSSSFTTDYAF